MSSVSNSVGHNVPKRFATENKIIFGHIQVKRFKTFSPILCLPNQPRAQWSVSSAQSLFRASVTVFQTWRLLCSGGVSVALPHSHYRVHTSQKENDSDG